MEYDRARHIALNREEYGDEYVSMRFITEEEARTAEAERQTLIEELTMLGVQSSYHGTKLHIGSLSPGCKICGAGRWSCLFINELCNARCFYCPNHQEQLSEPGTNSLVFEEAQDYIDYIYKFAFEGVSISGGEPLMSWERTIHFLRDISEQLPDDTHLWMYTNGTLVTAEKLQILREAGLKELRFDLSATSYDMRHLRMAIGVIPIVTVEIPAIPEDEERLSHLVGELQQAGVAHLHLHQLRATPYNLPHLSQRGYTLVHGPKVAVLESEMMALRILRYAITAQIALPINYCSMIYKHRYQNAAARWRSAPLLCKPHEVITAAGFLRTLHVTGSPDALEQLAASLTASTPAPTQRWLRDDFRHEIALHPDLLSIALTQTTLAENLRWQVSYDTPLLRSNSSYQRMFAKVAFNRHKSAVIERKPVIVRHPLALEDLVLLRPMMDETSHAKGIQTSLSPSLLYPPHLAEIERCEEIPQGLYSYY